MIYTMKSLREKNIIAPSPTELDCDPNQMPSLESPYTGEASEW
jgi:hypothetical protein